MVNILIGCTGSVASDKIPVLVDQIKHNIENCEVRVVATKHASHFFNMLDTQAQVYHDEDEWSQWSKMGDPVMHIGLRNWSGIFLIAPLDANTLGKIAHGLCDNLLTLVVRAWDMTKPLVFCPAMNTLMWEHPSTSMNINILQQWGYIEIPPISKMLACGEEGFGGMAEIATIVNRIQGLLKTSENSKSNP